MTAPSLQQLLDERAHGRQRPDGTTYRSLLHGDEQDIAALCELTSLEVQIAALRQGITPERYCRNQRTLSAADQIKLLGAHVAVVGQGGLGGTVTELLARIGIGYLTLIDGDVFEESNLNRQLLATVSALGQKKAEAGKLRVAAVNPALQARAVTDFLTEQNGEAMLEGADIAVDCLDSITSRFVLEGACRKRGIPLVSAAIAGTAGQATVIFPQDEGLRRIYGEPQAAQKRGAETRLGTLPYAATFMAAVECAEVVSLLLRHDSALRHCLLLANLDDRSMETIALP